MSLDGYMIYRLHIPISIKIYKGRPKNPRIIFWRAGPLSYRLPLLGECSRSPSVSVCQLVLVWEAALGFSECFWRLFQCICPFHGGWFTSAPVHTTLSGQQFLTKNGMTPVPHLPYSPDLTLSVFFVYLDKKSSKGNILQMWKRWNKKWQKH